MELGINFVPFTIAVVSNVALGMLWYSSKLMGKSWAAALGFDLKDLNANPINYFSAIAVTIVTVLITSFLMSRLEVHSFFEASELAMMLWLGFIVTTHFSSVIWAKKPFKVYFIDIGFLFFTTWINVLLLALWK